MTLRPFFIVGNGPYWACHFLLVGWGVLVTRVTSEWTTFVVNGMTRNFTQAAQQVVVTVSGVFLVKLQCSQLILIHQKWSQLSVLPPLILGRVSSSMCLSILLSDQPTTFFNLTSLSKGALAILLKCVGNTYTHCEHDLATPSNRSLESFLTDKGWRWESVISTLFPTSGFTSLVINGASSYLTNVAGHFRQLTYKTQTPCLLHITRP